MPQDLGRHLYHVSSSRVSGKQTEQRAGATRSSLAPISQWSMNKQGSISPQDSQTRLAMVKHATTLIQLIDSGELAGNQPQAHSLRKQWFHLLRLLSDDEAQSLAGVLFGEE